MADKRDSAVTAKEGFNTGTCYTRMMETVSVVIPTYKRPEKLCRAVESVRTQTRPPEEIIVVNDDPETEIDAVLPADGTIRTIEHDTNQGAPASRNDGIRVAKGDYVALLDDDDVWLKPKLEKQLARFTELDDDYGLVYTGQEIIRDGESIQQTRPEWEGNVADRLLYTNFIPSQSPLIRRECFDAVGLFDTSLASSQDRDMWLRIAQEYKVASVPEVLTASYHGHEGRISDDAARKYEGSKRFVEKHEAELRANPDALAVHHKQLGLYAAYLHRYDDANSHFREGLRRRRTDPVLFGYWLVSLLPSVLADAGFSLQRRAVRWYS